MPGIVLSTLQVFKYSYFYFMLKKLRHREVDFVAEDTQHLNTGCPGLEPTISTRVFCLD